MIKLYSMDSVEESSKVFHPGKSIEAPGLPYLTQPIKNHESCFKKKCIEYRLCARHCASHIPFMRLERNSVFKASGHYASCKYLWNERRSRWTSPQGELTKCWKHKKDSGYTCVWISSSQDGWEHKAGKRKGTGMCMKWKPRRTLLHHWGEPSMNYRVGNITGITTQQLHARYTLEMRLLDEPEGSHF